VNASMLHQSEFSSQHSTKRTFCRVVSAALWRGFICRATFCRGNRTANPDFTKNNDLLLEHGSDVANMEWDQVSVIFSLACFEAVVLFMMSRKPPAIWKHRYG
jgi:hypothetical protein